MTTDEILYSLSYDERWDILLDLIACLRDDRLRDCYAGWHLSKKGHARPNDDTHDEAPVWVSLAPILRALNK